MIRKLKGFLKLREKHKTDNSLNYYLEIIRCKETVREVIPEFPSDFNDAALLNIVSQLPLFLKYLRSIKRCLFWIMWCLILLVLFI